MKLYNPKISSDFVKPSIKLYDPKMSLNSIKLSNKLYDPRISSYFIKLSIMVQKFHQAKLAVKLYFS